MTRKMTDDEMLEQMDKTLPLRVYTRFTSEPHVIPKGMTGKFLHLANERKRYVIWGFDTQADADAFKEANAHRGIFSMPGPTDAAGSGQAPKKR